MTGDIVFTDAELLGPENMARIERARSLFRGKGDKMTKQDDIRAAEQAVIEAARALDAGWVAEVKPFPEAKRLRMALCSLDSLRQPPTALDVVERVRGWVRGKNDLDITGTCELLNQIEREIREAQP